MQIFIAGATGVLGRRLVRQFRERCHHVVGLARSEQNEAIIRELGGESRRADLFNADSVARAVEGSEIVVHAATAIPSTPKPRAEDWKTNDRIRREGTRALAEAAAKTGAAALVVQSITWVARPADQSAFDEDSPVHPDAVTQSAAEMEEIAREAGSKHGFDATTLRFSWFHSADSWHTRYFGEQLLARKFPIVGKGDAVWSWIHLDDAAGAMVTATEKHRSGLWHVTDNTPVSAAEYLGAFARRLGAPEPRHVPEWLARLMAGREAVNFMTSSTRTSGARFQRDFCWTPRFAGYEQALDQIVGQWRQENFLGQARQSAAAAGA
jgi:nucleoside-diphosphate-sugar epimerase